MAKIIGIVAVDREGAIGKGGRLPWYCSSDLKFFKAQTVGNVCVMGRRTWATLKRPLPGRLNVVLTSGAPPAPQASVVALRSRDEVMSLRDYLACDLYVIGGARVYQSFLGDVDRWLVTEVPLTVEGADTFMPEGYLQGFEPYDSLTLDDGLKVTFYERRQRQQQ